MLEYEVVESAPGAIVVRHPGQSAATGVFLAIYAVAAGGVLWYFGRNGASLTDGPVVPLLATLSLFASIMTAIRSHWRPGHVLRFYADAGVAEVDAEDGADAVRWPLAQFGAVETHMTISRTSSGSTTRWYHADLRLRDGSRLPVLRSRSERARDDLAGHLRAMVARAATKPAADVPTPALAASFLMQRDARETALAWRTTVRRRSFVSLIAVLISLLVLIGSLMRATLGLGGGFAWLPIAFLAVWALIPGLVIGLSLWHQVRTHQRVHGLRITHEAVAYESRGSLLPVRDAWSIGRDALAAVRVAWGTGTLEFPERPADEAAADAAPLVRTIEVGRLPMGQIVALEQWLQAELAARWGRKVG